MGKQILFIVLVIFFTVNAVIILSGRWYIYKGIANTYFKGRVGPSIYDLDVFAYSTLTVGKQRKWKKHENYNQQKLTQKEESFFNKYDSRAFLVFKNDELLFEKYWGNHKETTVSNSFSVAKTVVALLIGIATEEGHINSLDDPIKNYLNEFKGRKEGEITIRHLLTMSSGLSWSESGANPFSNNAESYYGGDLKKQVVRQRLIHSPGTMLNYQSGNSQLLGFILEAATKTDLSQYTEEKLWKKLGMNNKAFWSLDEKNGNEKAFCCLYATAQDFAKIGQLLNNQGKIDDEQIIPRWYYEEMIAPANLIDENGHKNTRYGYHIWLYDGWTSPVQYCRGILGQYVISVPEEKLLIIRLGEKRSPKYQLSQSKRNDANFVKENEHKIDHPIGLFEYLALAKKLTSKL